MWATGTLNLFEDKKLCVNTHKKKYTVELRNLILLKTNQLKIGSSVNELFIIQLQL